MFSLSSSKAITLQAKSFALLLAIISGLFLIAPVCKQQLSAQDQKGESQPAAKKKKKKSSKKKSALDNGSFYIEVDEDVLGKSPKFNASKELIAKTLIVHGMRQEKKKAKADYLVSGKLTYKFLRTAKFKFREAEFKLEHVYECKATLKLSHQKSKSKDLPKPEEFEKRYEFGSSNKDNAVQALRRLAGTESGKMLMHSSSLANKEVIGLIGEWTAESGKRSFNEISKDLIAHGIKAYPYLLMCCLMDDIVLRKGEFPGQSKKGGRSLRLFHIADHCLAEIQKEKGFFTKIGSRDIGFPAFCKWAVIWEKMQNIPKRHCIPKEVLDNL